MKSAQIDVVEYGYFVNNQWRKATDNKLFEVHEPYSGKLFGRVAAGSRADARIAVDAAAKAFPGWAETTPAEKAGLFLKAAEITRRRRSEIAEVLARETGSTISFATFQQDLVAATLQQVAGWAYLPKGEVLETTLPGTHSIGVRRPLGVVASFTPRYRGWPRSSLSTTVPPARHSSGNSNCSIRADRIADRKEVHHVTSHSAVQSFCRDYRRR